ncbi:MAG: SPFH domain-containing protein [Thermoplasmata archaeon]
MTIGLVLLLVLAVVLFSVVAFRTSFYIVQPHEAGILIVLGNYRGTLPPGVNIVPPFISMVDTVDLRVQMLTLHIDGAPTKDRKRVKMEATLYIKVTSAERAYFEVEDYRKAVYRLTRITIDKLISDMDLEDVIYGRTKISSKVKQMVNEQSEGWGVQVDNLEVHKIQEYEERRRG